MSLRVLVFSLCSSGSFLGWNPHVLEGVFQLASLRTATAKLSCHCEPQIEVSVISNNVPL